MNSTKKMPETRSDREAKLWFQNERKQVDFNEVYSVGEEIGRFVHKFSTSYGNKDDSLSSPTDSSFRFVPKLHLQFQSLAL